MLHQATRSSAYLFFGRTNRSPLAGTEARVAGAARSEVNQSVADRDIGMSRKAGTIQNSINVSSAFVMLLEEVEAQFNLINSEVTKTLAQSEHDKAKQLVEQSKSVASFRNRIILLYGEWEEIFATPELEKSRESPVPRPKSRRLAKGLRTPEKEFYVPILQVLESMGGEGEASEVVESVGRLMEPTLRDVDYEPLTSSNGRPRWERTTHFARNKMVGREGLLREGSPRGVWQISDKGRSMLKDSMDR